jgi:hypothetical protein
VDQRSRNADQAETRRGRRQPHGGLERTAITEVPKGNRALGTT